MVKKQYESLKVTIDYSGNVPRIGFELYSFEHDEDADGKVITGVRLIIDLALVKTIPIVDDNKNFSIEYDPIWDDIDGYIEDHNGSYDIDDQVTYLGDIGSFVISDFILGEYSSYELGSGGKNLYLVIEDCELNIRKGMKPITVVFVKEKKTGD